ncbi:uncharacterized protein LOC136039522 [Artemia franciscana]|uniref:Uncharacterized protein n=1 Tax=Artemia franciscana TaxID=6661 RepID=A0AA88I862_ARTSF|nr:hypothetical protein QYM36_007231 [Artemia franciscana]
MPLLRRCCCYFPLRRASVTLGVIGFTGSITSLIIVIIGRILVEDVANGVMSLFRKVTDVPYMMGTRHLSESEQEEQEQKLVEYWIDVYKILFIVCFIGMVISCIFSGLMVYGSVKSRKMLLVPWLVLGAINILGLITLVIVNMIYIDLPYNLIVLFLGIFCVSFMIHFWLVVVSFYQVLRDRERLELGGRSSEMKRLNRNY